MRTTIDLPDELYRPVKARAALKGVTMRELFIEALETVSKTPPVANKQTSSFPSFHLRSRRKLSLSGFNFDDLLT